MHSRYARFFQFTIIFGDLLLLNSCFLLAGIMRFDEIRIRNTDYYDYYVQLLVFFNLSWLFLSLLFKTYDTRRTLVPRKATGKVLNAYFIHLFILLLFLVSLKKDEYSRLFLIYFYVSFLVTILPWRFYFLRFLKAFRKKGFSFRKVVLLGTGSGLTRLYRSIKDHPEYGLEVAAYFSDNPADDVPWNGPESAFEEYASEQDIHELFCAYPSGDERLQKWFRFADENLLRFRVIPDLGVERATAVEIDFHHDVAVLVHRKEPLEYVQNRLLKRFGDVLLSSIIILTIFPWLFPLLAIGVRLSGKGPIFFRQRRTGLRDDGFSILKFRSMKLNEEADQKQAGINDDRITAFGRFMRRHNLDEMPQFFNVLKGEMSIVGPRPHMVAHTEEYRKLIDRYMVRHLVKPGITGLAQTSGLRGETESSEKMNERVKADVYYIENWSILLDMKIVVFTIFQTLVGYREDNFSK